MRTLNVWWPIWHGSWDHGLIHSALEGDLWPVGWEARHFEPRCTCLAPDGDGGVVVIPGDPLHIRDGEKQKATVELVNRLPWSVIIHTSDEQQTGSWVSGLMAERRRLWVQLAGPFKALPADRYHHVGPASVIWGRVGGTPPWMDSMPRKPLAERAHRWFFAGQTYGERRAECVKWLRTLPGALAVESGTFTGKTSGGMAQADYWRTLTDTMLAACPAAPHSPLTFRVYEALEAGCLPVADRRAPGWPEGSNQWTWLPGHDPAPFPTVDDWREAAALDDRYRDLQLVQADANRAQAWWQSYKRKFVLDLHDDIEATSGQPLPPPSPVTVLMPTSPIPCHPSLEVIEESIRRVRAYPELAQAEILIMVDGIWPPLEHRRRAYTEYTRRLLDECNWNPAWRGCLPVLFDQHTHQAEMTRQALAMVRTPLVMFVEHDTYPIGDIDWSGILRVFDTAPQVNTVRLHLFHRVLPEHQPLYATENVEIAGVPLRPTRQWSQRPHVSRTDWYRRLVARIPQGKRTMIEDAVIGWGYEEDWGAYVYAPAGDMTRSASSNGRRDDPKCEVA